MAKPKKKSVASKARSLARRGLISEKAMAKHVTKKQSDGENSTLAALDKTKPIA